jgi:hypothetical protein
VIDKMNVILRWINVTSCFHVPRIWFTAW